MRLRAVFLIAFAVVAFVGGIAFEHFIGSREILELSGWRQWMIVHQLRSSSGRAAVALAAAHQGRVMVALVFGQSNAGNSGESMGQPRRGVYEFHRGQLFEARDPLLGATGDGGSLWLRLGSKLIARGDFDSVILVPFAVGSSEIVNWAPGGALSAGVARTIAAAREAGLAFTHLLWQQGEADAIARTPAQVYREQFLAMLAAIRREGVNAPIFVARASRCGRVRPSEAIRGAQHALIDPALGILAGPDTDALGFAERFDGCHFSTEGLDRAAELWLDAIESAGGTARP